MDRRDLFTAGIFLIGFLSLLLVSFNAMLDARITPIKEDIHRVETRMDHLDSKLDKLIFLTVQHQSYKPHFVPKKARKTKSSTSRTTSSAKN